MACDAQININLHIIYKLSLFQLHLYPTAQNENTRADGTTETSDY